MPASDTSLGSAGGYPEGPEDGFYSRSLASTLDKLYVWEKKLYKEVKVCFLHNFFVFLV